MGGQSSSLRTKRLNMERAALPRLGFRLSESNSSWTILKAAQRRALAAGAREHSPVTETRCEMTGPHPIQRILQGAVVDRFGPMRLIQKLELGEIVVLR